MLAVRHKRRAAFFTEFRIISPNGFKCIVILTVLLPSCNMSIVTLCSKNKDEVLYFH